MKPADAKRIYRAISEAISQTLDSLPPADRAKLDKHLERGARLVIEIGHNPPPAEPRRRNYRSIVAMRPEATEKP